MAPPLRLWTIQTRNAWEAFQEAGAITATMDRVEPEFERAYRWIAGQMNPRLGPAPRRHRAPVWAWRQWQGEARARPDLRASGHLPRGTQGVRIEFVTEEKSVLFSDFSLWHFVLNYWYLPATPEEGDAFEAEVARRGMSFFTSKPLPDPALHARIEASWERILDLDWHHPDLAEPRPGKAIQATLWEVPLAAVTAVKPFVAR